MSTKSPNATTSKAQQILALYDGKRTTREIADEVGCDPAYVRVVARQRKGRGESAADKRYARSPRVIGRKRTRRLVLRATADLEAARAARRQAYRSARSAGNSVREATSISASAYMRVVSQTGDRKAANKAARHTYRARALEAAE